MLIEYYNAVVKLEWTYFAPQYKEFHKYKICSFNFSPLIEKSPSYEDNN